MASTALRTLPLPEIKPFRDRLTAEVPIYGAAPTGSNRLIAGRADAVARTEDGSMVVFDWKSDVAPKDAERAAYRQQLGQYLHVTGARRGAVVYMTTGRRRLDNGGSNRHIALEKFQKLEQGWCPGKDCRATSQSK